MRVNTPKPKTPKLKGIDVKNSKGLLKVKMSKSGQDKLRVQTISSEDQIPITPAEMNSNINDSTPSEMTSVCQKTENTDSFQNFQDFTIEFNEMPNNAQQGGSLEFIEHAPNTKRRKYEEVFLKDELICYNIVRDLTAVKDISNLYSLETEVFKCVKCCQVFSSSLLANTHATNCLETYDSSRPFVEMVVTTILMQCEFCNKVFTVKEDLLKHQSTHTTASNYSCCICNETFKSYEVAVKHWTSKCGEKNFFYLPKQTYCKICANTFFSHELFYSHVIKSKHYVPKKFEKQENSKDNGFGDFNKPLLGVMKVEVLKVEVPKVEVPKVEMNANSINIHYELYRFQCEICALHFELPFKLEIHRISVHLRDLETVTAIPVDSKPFETVISDYGLSDLVSGESYTCEICFSKFSSRGYFEEHVKSHQGLKPFGCPVKGCKARYMGSALLKAHIRANHPIEKLICDKCQAEYIWPSALAEHKNTCKIGGYCKVCRKGFAQQFACIKHMLDQHALLFPRPECDGIRIINFIREDSEA